jgi:hypothetical protein
VANAGDVWTMTDDGGGVRLPGPAGAAPQLRVPGSLLRAEQSAPPR